MQLKPHQDAFGRIIYDAYHGQPAYEIDERDDGFVALSPGPALYLAGYDQWPPVEQRAIGYARGRCLDIGCGGGRHSLYLQEKGLEVLAIDNSPLAVQTCLERGVRQAQVLGLNELSARRLGVFDTLLMLGNNFGLCGTFQRAKRLLPRLARLAAPHGRLLAGLRNPYDTDQPEHLAYHERNRQRGRMAGEARIRIRYKGYRTPWIGFLMLSPQEFHLLVDGTPWQIAETLQGDAGNYLVVLEKR